MKYWECFCGAVNIRETHGLIFDDVCDMCGKHIHEPITEKIEKNDREIRNVSRSHQRRRGGERPTDSTGSRDGR